MRHGNEANHFVSGDRGVSEWRFTGTSKERTSVEMMGCDLFEFVGDKIKVKDSYRKQKDLVWLSYRPPQRRRLPP